MKKSEIQIDATSLIETLDAISKNPPVKDNSGKKEEFKAFKQGFSAGINFVSSLIKDSVNKVEDYQENIEEIEKSEYLS